MRIARYLPLLTGRASSRLSRSGDHQARRASGLTLHVANPAEILNGIAQRYANAPRLIMEYVDNAIDDAEEDFRNHGQSYSADVKIQVTVDKKAREVCITDNCRGLTNEQLVDVVQTVGESKKKGLSWLNGRFGFGIHAFRAAAKSLHIETRKEGQDGAWSMTVTRDQSEGIDPPKSIESPFEGESTGTRITLSDIDTEWLRELNSDSIADEIELHFERLLARERLNVEVADLNSGVIRPCEPFDYAAVEGTELQKTLTIRDHPVSLFLKVSGKEFQGKSARFFSNGRRINEVATVQSFMKVSAGKQSLWAHPQLIGFIDVGETVEPVITRDEFQQTAMRRQLYNELKAFEPQLQEALDAELEKQRVFTLTSLEGVLGSILERVVKDDIREVRRAARAQNAASVSGDAKLVDDGESTSDINSLEAVKEDISQSTQRAKERVTKESSPKKEKPAMFQVRLVELPEGGGRSRRIGNDQVEINVAHPDFQSRLRTSKGRPKFNDRLGSYLAAILADHYNELGQSVPDRQHKELLDSFTKLEAAARRRMPALQRSVHSFLDA